MPVMLLASSASAAKLAASPYGMHRPTCQADCLRTSVEGRGELGDESCLADAGNSDEGDELRRTVARGKRERVSQQLELSFTIDDLLFELAHVTRRP